MADKEKEAYWYWKGYIDFKKCGGLAGSPLKEFISPSYNPPAGYKEAYDAGWIMAKYEPRKK